MSDNKISRILLIIVSVFLVLFLAAGVYFLHAGNTGVGIAAFGAAVFGLGLMIFSQTLVMTDTQTLVDVWKDGGDSENDSAHKKISPKKKHKNLTAYDIEFDTTFKAKAVMKTDGDSDSNNEADVYVGADRLYIEGLEPYLVEFPYNKMRRFHMEKLKDRYGNLTGKSRMTMDCDAVYADQSLKTMTMMDARKLSLDAVKQALILHNVEEV